jgi:23S rRNA pseudoU1915 N3-methylase RlmH
MGDGILAYFGYPRAHEDDAERAARAGVDIGAAVEKLETLAKGRLSVRIGARNGETDAARRARNERMAAGKFHLRLSMRAFVAAQLQRFFTVICRP